MRKYHFIKHVSKQLIEPQGCRVSERVINVHPAPGPRTIYVNPPRSPSVVKVIAPSLHLRIKGDCRWMTTMLPHGQDNKSGIYFTDIGPLDNFANRCRARDSELCCFWRPGGSGSLGALWSEPCLGLACLLQAEREGWERCLKPDLPLAQQVFIYTSQCWPWEHNYCGLNGCSVHTAPVFSYLLHESDPPSL